MDVFIENEHSYRTIATKMERKIQITKQNKTKEMTEIISILFYTQECGWNGNIPADAKQNVFFLFV